MASRHDALPQLSPRPPLPGTHQSRSSRHVDQARARHHIEQERARHHIEQERALHHIEQTRALPRIEQARTQHHIEQAPALHHIEQERARHHIEQSRSLPRIDRRQALLGLAGGALLLGCRSESAQPAGEPPAPANTSPNAQLTPFTARGTMEGRGARVKRLFPLQRGLHLDPFVLLDDFAVAPPAGFPMHPHRGFEAFTYMIDGSFHHRDTMGNDSRVQTGGTQRFTSGRGARHSEMPGLPRPNRGLQLWVNLPQKLKKIAPEYNAVQGQDIPENAVRGALVRTVVGPQSPVTLRSDVRYLDMAIPGGTRFAEEVKAGHNAILYIAKGRARIGDIELTAGDAVLPHPGEVGIKALADTRVFLIAGQPHGEPIYQHGPYVD